MRFPPWSTARDREEQRRYYAASGHLRKNGGHIDLERGRQFRRCAQFFALFHDAAEAPADGMWAQCQRMHDFFLREMADNADIARHCRTGAEVEEAVAQGKVAALLSIEGADLIDCDVHKIETVAGWGVRLLNPVWNRANVLSGTNAEEPERGLSAEGRGLHPGAGGARHLSRRVPPVRRGLLGSCPYGASGLSSPPIPTRGPSVPTAAT